jgi:hypothetical protein
MSFFAARITEQLNVVPTCDDGLVGRYKIANSLHKRNIRAHAS